MEKALTIFGKVLLAVLLLTVLAIIANATIVPVITDIANQLNHINWYGVNQMFQTVLKYTVLAVFGLMGIAFAFKKNVFAPTKKIEN